MILYYAVHILVSIRPYPAATHALCGLAGVTAWEIQGLLSHNYTRMKGDAKVTTVMHIVYTYTCKASHG